MGVTLLKSGTLDKFRDRISALTADSKGQWGKLTLPGMLRHLSFTFEMSLGKVEIEPLKNPAINNPVTQNLVKILFFYLFTNWPKGKIKSPPNFQPPPPGEFEAERERLLEELQDFVVQLENNPSVKHRNPMLGL